jgi:hypothetical protein
VKLSNACNVCKRKSWRMHTACALNSTQKLLRIAFSEKSVPACSILREAVFPDRSAGIWHLHSRLPAQESLLRAVEHYSNDSSSAPSASFLCATSTPQLTLPSCGFLNEIINHSSVTVRRIEERLHKNFRQQSSYFFSDSALDPEWKIAAATEKQPSMFSICALHVARVRTESNWLCCIEGAHGGTRSLSSCIHTKAEIFSTCTISALGYAYPWPAKEAVRMHGQPSLLSQWR